MALRHSLCASVPRVGSTQNPESTASFGARLLQRSPQVLRPSTSARERYHRSLLDKSRSVSLPQSQLFATNRPGETKSCRYELRREIKESEQILSQALRLNENHQTARESLQRVQEKLRTLGLNAGRDLPNTSSSSQTEDRFPNVAAPESLDRGRLKDLLIQQMKEKHNYGGPSSVNSKDLLGDPSRPATSGASRHLDNHDGERRRSHSKRCGDKSSSSSSKDRKRHKSKRHKSSHGRRRSSSKHRERSSRGSSL
eukprot:gb/GECG01014361.1/.p1 GENE.gb/GECG01014361.1/~~gb/GECG01014361.1/.p1  ORF type:complete len:255 (+),score=23.98 gb/GECG01014361.1/:1-765(+)